MTKLSFEGGILVGTDCICLPTAAGIMQNETDEYKYNQHDRNYREITVCFGFYFLQEYVIIRNKAIKSIWGVFVELYNP